MTKTTLIFTALVLATSQAQAINKCPGPDGRPVFQDAPCDGGQAVNARPAMGRDNPSAARAEIDRVRQQADRMERQRLHRETLDAIKRDHQAAQRAITARSNERDRRECEIAQAGLRENNIERPGRTNVMRDHYRDKAIRHCN